jgi:hypothetical protein
MVLYGILYDRTKLSIENDWFDEKGRAFIYYTRGDIEGLLKVGKSKAIELFKELNKYDLIEEIRQGMNMPNKIYVGKFTLSTSSNPSNSRKSEKQTSGGMKNKPLEVRKTNPNNNYNNNNNRVYKTFNNFTNRTYDAKALEEKMLEASKNDLL